jgi:hypothetical protein
MRPIAAARRGIKRLLHAVAVVAGADDGGADEKRSELQPSPWDEPDDEPAEA